MVLRTVSSRRAPFVFLFSLCCHSRGAHVRSGCGNVGLAGCNVGGWLLGNRAVGAAERTRQSMAVGLSPPLGPLLPFFRGSDHRPINQHVTSFSHSMTKCVNGLWHSQKMESYPAVNRNDLSSPEKTWRNLTWPSISEWIDQLLYAYALEDERQKETCYQATKRR